MTPEVANATDACVARMAKTAKRFSLGFFGGEPLLAPDLVARVLKTAYNNAPDKKIFTSSITTHRSLPNAEIIKEFADHKLWNYQIT